MVDVKTVFKQQFGYHPTHVVRAPGCLEVLGSQADYHAGLALAIAVNKHVAIASAPRGDGKVELVSSAFPERDLFWISDLEKHPVAPWADYVKGVLSELRRHDVHFGGFNAAVQGTLPMGEGFNSSAALQVATALTVRQLHPYRLTETGAMSRPPRRDKRGDLPPLSRTEKLAIARICQAAERAYVGTPGSLVEPLVSLHGKAFNLLAVDCRFHTVELLPMHAEVVFIVCPSGVQDALASSKTQALRQHGEAAAWALGARTLRSVEPRYLSARKKRLTQRQYECAYHVVGDLQRVIFGQRALLEGDFAQFGQYLFQSHESARLFFGNSCPELDLLVNLARAHPGCLGAKLTGPGFGGATINLVTHEHYEDFLRNIPAQYAQCTDHQIKPMICLMADGAK